jgi:predicted peptidase
MARQEISRPITTAHCCAGLHYLLRTPPSSRGGGGGWPLLLFLHGAGERGPADGSRLRRAGVHGPLKVCECGPHGLGLPNTRQFLICVPQCHPAPLTWADFLPSLKAVVDRLCAEYPVDIGRIYLTGLSMGGMGSWALAHRYPSTFAAVAPICGGAWTITGWSRPRGGPRPQLSAADMAPLARLPVYIFHGQRDPVVPVSGSTDAFAALVAAGNRSARLAIYPQTDLPEDHEGRAAGAHDSWTQTYEWAGLYEWFLEHRSSGGGSAPTSKL